MGRRSTSRLDEQDRGWTGPGMGLPHPTRTVHRGGPWGGRPRGMSESTHGQRCGLAMQLTGVTTDERLTRRVRWRWVGLTHEATL
jgi:hypothetical protein